MSSRAEKNLTIIEARAAEAGQSAMAAAINVDVSTVSRMFADGKVKQLAGLLAALDLKVVHADHYCVPKHELDQIVALYTRSLARVKRAEDLWPDDDA